MATLAKLLQVDMGLPEMAKRLAAAGRGKDTILAHINPKEARLLKKHGGSGKINPDTGIMEFTEDEETPIVQQTVEEKPANRSAGEEVSAYPTAGIVGDVPAAAGPANTIPSPGPSVETPPLPGATPVGQGFAGPITATSTKTPTAAPAAGGGGGGFIEGLKNFGNQLGDLNKALSPVVPYLKGGAGLVAAAQGNKASEQMQQQAAANEAEIRKLSEPYRQRGQQLVELGQAGGLTPQQQKQLEIQRAVASQQMASSGVTGGTAQQQLEANLQQQAANFAQQNIDQGMKIMGIADEYIMKAMNTGYAENKDAQSLAMDFYKAIGQFLGSEANTSPAQSNAAPKP